MKITTSLIVVWLSLTTLSACSNTPSDSGKDYYTQLGVGYLEKGRLDLAKLNLEKALHNDSSSEDANHYYALLQERLGDDAKANDYFRKALRVNKKNPELLNNYGSFLCRTGHIDTALQAFNAAVRDPLYKTPEFAYTNAGICAIKKGDTAAAEEYFHQSLQANNAYPETLYQMATLNHSKRDNAKAQAFLYRYNAIAAPNPDSLLLCYKIETALNEAEKAEACVDDLRAKFPDSKAASQLN